MLAAKKHDSSKAEPVPQGKTNQQVPESFSPQINPLWLQLATSLETSAERCAGVTSPPPIQTKKIVPFIQRQAEEDGELEETPVLPKLTIGSPGDEYEREADLVADQVMRMPDPTVHRKPG